jgi:hypothetical protein
MPHANVNLEISLTLSPGSVFDEADRQSLEAFGKEITDLFINRLEDYRDHEVEARQIKQHPGSVSIVSDVSLWSLSLSETSDAEKDLEERLTKDCKRFKPTKKDLDTLMQSCKVPGKYTAPVVSTEITDISAEDDFSEDGQ